MGKVAIKTHGEAVHHRAPRQGVKRLHDQDAEGHALRVENLRRHTEIVHIDGCGVLGRVGRDDAPGTRTRHSHGRMIDLQATDEFGAQAKEAQLPVAPWLAHEDHEMVGAVGAPLDPGIARRVELRVQGFKDRYVGVRAQGLQRMLLPRLPKRLRLDALCNLGLLKRGDFEPALGPASRGQTTGRKGHHWLRQHHNAVEVALGTRALGKVQARDASERGQKRHGLGERVAKPRQQTR